MDTPPTFVDGQILSAAQLNTLRDIVNDLQQVGAAPVAPFLAWFGDRSDGPEYNYYWLRHRYRYLHISYEIGIAAAVQLKVRYNTYTEYDLTLTVGTRTVIVDTNTVFAGLVVGTFYEIRIKHQATFPGTLRVYSMYESESAV